MIKRILVAAGILCLAMAATPALAVTANHFQNLTVFNNTIDPNAPPPCATGQVLTYTSGSYICRDNHQGPPCPTGQAAHGVTAGGVINCMSNSPPGGCGPGQGARGFDANGNPTQCIPLRAIPTPPSCSTDTTLVTSGYGTTCNAISKMEIETINNVRAISQNGWCTVAGSTYKGDPDGAGPVPAMTGFSIPIFCNCRGVCQGRGYGEGWPSLAVFGHMGCVCIK